MRPSINGVAATSPIVRVSCGEVVEKGGLQGVDPREQAAFHAGFSEEAAHVADIAPGVDVDVQRLPRRSQGEGDLRPAAPVRLEEGGEGEVGQDVAVVHDETRIPGQQVRDVFQAAARVEQDRLMSEDDGTPPPGPVREGPVVRPGQVVGVDDESLDARGGEMVHGVCDERPPADGQQRLGAAIGQGFQARAQAGAQDEGRFEGRGSHALQYLRVRTAPGK